MPRGNGTGPMGAGPMTGRAAGYCAGYQMPGFMNPVGGRGGMGFGRGMGMGRGMRFWNAPGYYAYPPVPYTQSLAPEQEAGVLRQQADVLKEQLQSIETRLGEIEKNVKKSS